MITITWSREDEGPMIITQSDGTETILPFEDAVSDGVALVADLTGDSVLTILHHFAQGDTLEIDT